MSNILVMYRRGSATTGPLDRTGCQKGTSRLRCSSAVGRWQDGCAPSGGGRRQREMCAKKVRWINLKFYAAAISAVSQKQTMMWYFQLDLEWDGKNESIQFGLPMLGSFEIRNAEFKTLLK